MEIGGGEVEEQFPPWDKMNPDLLAQVFKHLSLRSKLTILPRVCRSWNNLLLGPHCWTEIHIKKWSFFRRKLWTPAIGRKNQKRRNLRPKGPADIDRLLQILLERSAGSLVNLSVCNLRNDESLQLIADHAGESLKVLKFTRSRVTDGGVVQVAPQFSTLTFIDISYCASIGAAGIDALGRHCPLLIDFRRRMSIDDMVVEPEFPNAMAHAISATMPNLTRLQFHECVTMQDVLEILSCCPGIEELDLIGSNNVALPRTNIKQMCLGLKLVIGIHLNDDSGLPCWLMEGVVFHFYFPPIPFNTITGEGSFYTDSDDDKKPEKETFHEANIDLQSLIDRGL